MKEFIKKNKVQAVLVFLGLIGGYLYWRFVGCSSGNCPLTSNWYSSSAIGGIMAYLLSDSINDFRRKKSQKNAKNLG